MTPGEALAVQVRALEQGARDLWKDKASRRELAAVAEAVKEHDEDLKDKASSAEVAKLSDDVRALRNAIVVAAITVAVSAIGFSFTVLQTAH